MLFSNPLMFLIASNTFPCPTTLDRSTESLLHSLAAGTNSEEIGVFLVTESRIFCTITALETYALTVSMRFMLIPVTNEEGIV